LLLSCRFLCVVIVYPRSGSLNYLEGALVGAAFTDQPIQNSPGIPTTIKFPELQTIDDIWYYLNTTFVQNLFVSQWYNGVPLNYSALVLYQNRLLGAVQLRQVRTKAMTCPIPDFMRVVVPNCFLEYTDDYEFRGTFEPVPGSRFRWRSEGDVGDRSHWGRLTTYPGSGFTAILPGDMTL
jgi:hypothetical protein